MPRSRSSPSPRGRAREGDEGDTRGGGRRRSERDRRGESRSRSRSRDRDRRDHRRSGRRSRSRSRSRSRDRSRRDDERRSARTRRDRHDDRRDKRERRDDRRDRKRRRRSRSSSSRASSSTSSRSSSSSTSSSSLPAASRAGRPTTTLSSASTAKAGGSGQAGVLPSSSSASSSGLFGYTAENNPFGDSNLAATFVWGKKIEKDIQQGKRDRPPTKMEQIQEREALVTEIEKARARREAREKEREEMERLRAEETRMRDAAEHAGWEKQDDDFMMAQARERAFARLRDGRATLADALLGNTWLMLAAEEEASGSVLSHGLASGSLSEEGANAALRHHALLDSPADLLLSNGALADQKTRTELLVEAQQTFALLQASHRLGSTNAFRRAALVYLESLASVLSADPSPSMMLVRPGSEASGPDAELEAMFEGVDEAGLQVMERQVRDTLSKGAAASSTAGQQRAPYQPLIDGPLPPVSTLAGGTSAPAVDLDYWEKVLARLLRVKAFLQMRRAFENVLFLRLKQLGGFSSSTSSSSSASASSSSEAVTSISLAEEVDEDKRRETIEAGVAALRAAGILPPPSTKRADGNKSNSGGGSFAAAPRAMSAASFPSGFAAPDPDASVADGLPTGFEEADFGGASEVVVSLPAGVSSSSSSWSSRDAGATAPGLVLEEKYKPRKPRYFNRVKTGYDWNKYNQTHYDHDNPPPKTVQGYKFNIFYPDLLDKSKTPQFFLEPVAGDLDHCIIRFQGGPPYEDLAFKIVNKEWEYQKKHGFRCVFDKGVLQLHFNFRRARYRK